MHDRIELCLPATASSVGEVRNAVVGLAQAIGLDDARVSDVQLAVSEAATNAVQYGGSEGGKLRIEASAVSGELQIAISDRGGGVRPRPDSPGLGMGMPLMAALSDRLEVVSDGEGTTVRMSFAYST